MPSGNPDIPSGIVPLNHHTPLSQPKDSTPQLTTTAPPQPEGCVSPSRPLWDCVPEPEVKTGTGAGGMENGNGPVAGDMEWNMVSCQGGGSSNDSLLDNISTPSSSDSELSEEPLQHSLQYLLHKK